MQPFLRLCETYTYAGPIRRRLPQAFALPPVCRSSHASESDDLRPRSFVPASRKSAYGPQYGPRSRSSSSLRLEPSSTSRRTRLGGHVATLTSSRSLLRSSRSTVWRQTQERARWSSSDAKAAVEEPTQYSFEEIQSLSSEPEGSAGKILIDVREASELEETGIIPTAMHMPMTSAPEALFLPPEEFEARFGFALPSRDRDRMVEGSSSSSRDSPTEMIFYCKAGVRARAAAAIAKEAGWARVGVYKGSWNDWSKRGGDVEAWKP